MGFSNFYTPEYLQQTSTGLFLFRKRVPKDCLTVIGKSELKYSLKTRSLREARNCTSPILSFLKDTFNSIRLRHYSSQTEININQTIKDGIDRARLLELSPALSRFTTKDKINHTNTPKKDSDSPLIVSSNHHTPESPSENNTPFTSLKDAFFKEKELSDGWRFKTMEDHRQVFSLFVEIFGDVCVESIGKVTMRKFKDTIAGLPPNMRKIAKYKNRSIDQILKMRPDKTLSTHTINKYLSRLSNLFAYGVTHGYLSANPASGLKVKLKTRPDEEREAYSQVDLKTLFGSAEFTDKTQKHSYGYWTPLIGVYTGCRLEEICQLHLEDIRKESGVWVFDINDKHEKSLKNLSSIRLVPIHPHLIELGLLDHVKTLKAKGEQRLFPELRQRRDGYGQAVSRWFQGFKKRCGFDAGKNFHSFRHTFITHLKHKQVDPFMIHELDGHTINSETMGRYGKRYTPEILLREAIKKIDYGLVVLTKPHCST
ncbi:MAG: site-specific integrase [Desulforhopalus sp.]